MRFRILFDIPSGQPSTFEKARRYMRGSDGEGEFWRRFSAAVPHASAIAISDLDALHERLWTEFPAHLRRRLIDRLMVDPRVAPAVTVSVAAGAEAVPGAGQPPPLPPAQQEKQTALSGISVHVARVGSGSLEILIVVYGLAALAGIDASSLAEHIQAAAPDALKATFGVLGALIPLVVSAMPDQDAADPPPRSSSAGALSARGIPYLIPAALAGFIAWFGITTLGTVSDRLLDERKALSEALHQERQAISAQRTNLTDAFLKLVKDHERTALEDSRLMASKVSDLALALVASVQKREDGIEATVRSLSTEQTKLIVALTDILRRREAGEQTKSQGDRQIKDASGGR